MIVLFWRSFCPVCSLSMNRGGSPASFCSASRDADANAGALHLRFRHSNCIVFNLANCVPVAVRINSSA